MRWVWAWAALGLVGCQSETSVSLPDAGAFGAALWSDAPVRTSTGVDHQLRFPHPATHDIEVRSIFPTEGRDQITLSMPVWTPGSYLVREYAQFIEDIAAHDAKGRALPLTKVRKNRFEARTNGASSVVLTYRVYAHRTSVRTNFVDPDLGVIIPAATFFADVDRPQFPHAVQIDPPDSWPRVVTALSPHPDGSKNRFLAPNFDALVDAPIVAGDADVRTFSAGGATHELAHFGDRQFWPLEDSLRDVEKITQATIQFWGHAPYSRYVFLNVINEGGGGLEHAASTLMMTKRFAAQTGEGYRGWLALVAHELFHTWNGKRLRPHNLGPFDYENEVYTKDLWAVEGLTSYYDILLPCRAGVMTEAQCLEYLSNEIERLETTPGRHHETLAMSSYNAWIKFYRSHENSRNTSISYYNKGAVVSFILDAALRRATGDKKSLDDVMRAAYAAYAGQKGYTNEAFLNVFETVGGQDVRALAHRLVHTTTPLDYTDALAWFGLRFRPEPKPPSDADKAQKYRRDRSWLGIETRQDRGRRYVSRIWENSPAERAGVSVDDELIALDEIRIDRKGLKGHLRMYKPKDEVEITLARRGRLIRRSVRIGQKPNTFEVQIDPSANARAKARRASWLMPR